MRQMPFLPQKGVSGFEVIGGVNKEMAVEALEQSREHKAVPRKESERFIVPTHEEAITAQQFDYRWDGASKYGTGEERASEQEIELSLDS